MTRALRCVRRSWHDARELLAAAVLVAAIVGMGGPLLVQVLAFAIAAGVLALADSGRLIPIRKREQCFRVALSLAS
jgi:hypothetical protein